MPARLPPATLSLTCSCDRRRAANCIWAEQTLNDTLERRWETLSYVIVKHTVGDYARWKTIFDADSANRQATGSKGGQIFRSADDPNEVVILFAWDLEKARQYSQSEEVRAKMQEAGVLDPPEFYFLEEIEQLSR
jgi:hypothetical protein